LTDLGFRVVSTPFATRFFIFLTPCRRVGAFGRAVSKRWLQAQKAQDTGKKQKSAHGFSLNTF
jgi:hypothetical protein|tara:strand:- start:186 stop:374 length:189 start_codon:yes stop_codon:yes gene_type:complete